MRNYKDWTDEERRKYQDAVIKGTIHGGTDFYIAADLAIETAIKVRKYRDWQKDEQLRYNNDLKSESLCGGIDPESAADMAIELAFKEV